jgi:hypothetical protein
METHGETEQAAGVSGVLVPEIYSVYGSDGTRSQPEQAEWVIKGTDGKLYLVSSEPGG